MRTSDRRLPGWALGCVVAAVTPGFAAEPGSPAAATAPADTAGGAIEEVIVTARLIAENLQDVPLSIAAFDAADLSAQGGNSLADVSQLTAGLNFEAFASAGYPVLTLRGLSATSITAFESNVSTFLGGVYLPRAYMVDAGLTGIERVEVVKGPQSALYGRNAFSGAVNFVPVAAPDAFTLNAAVTGGSDERLDYGLTMGGPLGAGGVVRVIGGANHSEFDGTWDNAHPLRDADAGGTRGKMGGWDNDSYFATVAIAAHADLDLTLGWNRTERTTEAAGRYNISRNTGQANCSLVGGVLQFYCGELPRLDPIVDPRSTGLIADSDVYRAEVSYSLADAWTASYLFGRAKSEAYSYDQTSIDSINGDTPAGVQFLGLPVGSIESDSHELRVSFDGETRRLTFGAFLADSDDVYRTLLVNAPSLQTTPLTPSSPGQTTVQSNLTSIETRAAFGQFAQDLAGGRFNLSVEGRYTEEEKQLVDRVSGTVDRATFTSFTPRAVAVWNVNDDSNVYLSAAKGLKSGGFNGGNILPAERTYEPEQNWTYELGSKNVLLGRRLRLNAAAYFVDWSDLQTLSLSANPAFLGSITRNVGEATSYGFELEGILQLTPGLRGSLQFAWSDPKYGDDLVDPRYLFMRTAAGALILICDGITCPQDGSIGGNSLPRQSRLQASLGLRQEGSLAAFGGLEFTLGGDLSYKSKQYVDPLILTWAPDRTLLNLNASVSRGAWSLEFFARNALDSDYVASATYNLTGNRNVRYEGVLGERRTWGATVRFRL
jgi:iron complex outermembrane recepter protein